MLNTRVNEAPSFSSNRGLAARDLRRLSSHIAREQEGGTSAPFRMDLFDRPEEVLRVHLQAVGSADPRALLEPVLAVRNQIAAIEEVRQQRVEVMWGGTDSRREVDSEPVMARLLTTEEELALQGFANRLPELSDQALREARRNEALNVMQSEWDPVLASARYRLTRAETERRKIRSARRRRATPSEQRALFYLNALRARLRRIPQGVWLERTRVSHGEGENVIEVEVGSPSTSRRSSSAPAVLMDTVSAVTAIGEVCGVRIHVFRLYDDEPHRRVEITLPPLEPQEVPALDQYWLDTYRKRLEGMSPSELELELGERVAKLGRTPDLLFSHRAIEEVQKEQRERTRKRVA